MIEDEFGKVDLNFPNVIFFFYFSLLENYHSNEIKNFLIHEFAHLANPIKSAHGNKKTVFTFSSMALVFDIVLQEWQLYYLISNYQIQ